MHVRARILSESRRCEKRCARAGPGQCGLAMRWVGVLLAACLAVLAVAGRGSVAQTATGEADQAWRGDGAAFLVLLTKQELAEYTALKSREEREAWRRRYWNQRDPTPGTERNERYEEHLRRVEYARTMYSWPNLRGFDDRGEIYVRYGQPDDWYQMSIPTPGIRANESWVYHGLGQYGCFDFVDDGSGYFRLVNSLREAIRGANWERPALSLYGARSDLSPFYARIYRALVRDQELQVNPLPDLTQPLFDRERALAEQPHEADFHYFEKAKLRPMRFPFYHAVFRRGKGALLEVYYGIPASPLRKDLSGDRVRLTVDFALFDSTWQDLIRQRKDKSVRPKNLSRDLKQNLLVDVLRAAILQSGAFHYMLGVTDSTARRAAVYKAKARVPAWPEGKLALSGLELAYNIEPGSHPKFVKPGLTVIPNPARRYRRDQPCWLYFEIYNLALDPSGHSHYRTTLTLTRLGRDRLKRRSLFSRLAGLVRGGEGRSQLSLVSEAQGFSPTEYVSLQLDIGQLAPGEYQLRVQVDDLEAGMSASRDSKLWVAE